jgi:hypothetical protein
MPVPHAGILFFVCLFGWLYRPARLEFGEHGHYIQTDPQGQRWEGTMKLTNVIGPAVLVVAVGLTGCSNVGPLSVSHLTPTNSFENLETRDNLLHNLELAYNRRDFGQFKRLFDNSGAFRFVFSPADVQNGAVKDSQWDLHAELEATERLLDPDPPPGQPRADQVDLDLEYAEGDDEWQPVVPATHPDEIWHNKRVRYALTVKIGHRTYFQGKAVYALFTVRRIDIGDKREWRIVTWRDDVGR